MNNLSSGKGALVWILLLAVLGVAIFFLLQSRDEVVNEVENNVQTATISGLVYAENVTFQEGTEVRVVLEDITLADTPVSLGEATFVATGEETSVPFAIQYNSEDIVEANSYILRAIITDVESGFATEMPMPVLTSGFPSDNIEIVIGGGEEVLEPDTEFDEEMIDEDLEEVEEVEEDTEEVSDEE